MSGVPVARRAVSVLAWLALAWATAAGAADLPAGGPSVGVEAEFLALLNGTRVAAGLAPLEVEDGLVGFARGHTREMVGRGDLFHSEEGMRLAAAPAGWRRLGENVGVGSTPERLHALFMSSPPHRDNILGDFSSVAIGAARAGDGHLYVTVVFVKRANPPQTRLAMKN